MFKHRRLSVILSALILSGCAPDGADPAALDRDIRCTVNVSGDRSYSAELERVDNTGWNVKLTSPESAKGIEIGYMNDGLCSFTVQGHTIVYTEADIPGGGVFDLVLSAADNCIENRGVSFVKQGGKNVAKGEIRGMDFTALSENGCITSIEVGSRIKAEFSYLPDKEDK